MIFLMVSSEAQMFLILIKSSLSVFFLSSLKLLEFLISFKGSVKLNVTLDQRWTLFRIESFNFFVESFKHVQK